MSCQLKQSSLRVLGGEAGAQLVEQGDRVLPFIEAGALRWHKRQTELSEGFFVLVPTALVP